MWLIEFLLSLPLWALALVLNAWLMGTAWFGVWAARRWILPRLRLTYDDAYFGAAVVQSAMLLYGLVAALTAIGVWQKHSQTSDTVSAEATSIASLWRDLGGYPPPVRDAMRNTLRSYTRQIIEDAWPIQRRGEIPSEGVEWMNRLQDRLFAFEPATEGQKILHAETMARFNELIEKRRQRLDSVQSGLPGVFWWMLLPGAMACIALCLFFQLESARFHRTLLIGLAGFLSMVLFVIIALDRPLRGGMAIGAESYELIYDHHMRD